MNSPVFYIIVAMMFASATLSVIFFIAWKTLVKKACLPDSLHFKMIRKLTEDTAHANECHIGAAIILGHKLPGASDHYTRRTPETARKACAAVMGAVLGRTSISTEVGASIVTSKGKRKTVKRTG